MSRATEQVGAGGENAAGPHTATEPGQALDALPVDVRAYFSLAAFLSPPGRTVLAHSPGLDVAGAAAALGIPVAQVGFVLKNGCRAELDEPVAPGDRVAFYPDYVPFHKVYGACVV